MNKFLPYVRPTTFGQGFANGMVIANLWGILPTAIIAWALVR